MFFFARPLFIIEKLLIIAVVKHKGYFADVRMRTENPHPQKVAYSPNTFLKVADEAKNPHPQKVAYSPNAFWHFADEEPHFFKLHIEREKKFLGVSSEPIYQQPIYHK